MVSVEPKKKNAVRIASVYAPLTLNSSWRTTVGEDFDVEFNTKNTYFAFSKFSNQWIDIKNVYMRAESLVWLLSLPFKLMNGKFHLFVTGVRYPEGIIAFVTSKLLRRPIIIRDTYWYWSRDFIANSLFWPIARFAAMHANVFTVDSQRVKKLWTLAGVPEGKTRTIHYYVSMIKIRDQHISMARELKEKLHAEFIILYIGRLVKLKGLEYLINAFARLSKEKENLALYIVGDGPERKSLERLTAQLSLDNVIFTGAKGPEEKPAYFLLCDVLVYPSILIRSPEEWGLAVNEAMSIGKPVIVTDVVGSAYELVKQGVNGYIVPEKDIDSLYSALKKLVENHDLRVKMGQNAKETIMESFTVKHLSDSVLELVRYVLSSQKS